MGNIEHHGNIIAIDGHLISVEMTVSSACVSCQVKSSCAVAEDVAKRVVVYVDTPEYFSINETVIVEITQTMGIKAVAYAYVTPLFLLMSSLLICLKIGLTEIFSGLFSLGLVFLYYICLFFLRKFIEREIIFNLKKL